MAEVRGLDTWLDELASLVEDPGIIHTEEIVFPSLPPLTDQKPTAVAESDHEMEPPEALKEQLKEFLKSWCEMILELGRGCRDVLQQTVVTEDSFIVKKLGGPVAKVSSRLGFLNEFLPEDRDPIHAWPVIFFVFILALSALNLNGAHDVSAPPVKKVLVHPPSASRIQLPDGRHLAYRAMGVPVDKARFSLIAPHSFLSSRLAGIPGVKTSLLEEFGVRLVTYDLPGFGESDPHPSRNLNSSAFDMLHLADAVGVNDKFWVLGYSSGSIHAWAALRHVSHKIAGAAMVTPMINPYEPSLTKEEMQSKHGRIENWMSVSLGRRDEILTEGATFEDFWHRDVEESIRQGNTKPFIEEAVLQVSNWGFRLADLQVQRKCYTNGIFPWLKSLYSQAECELTGFLGPIHIWQGMDDQAVPQGMIDYISRVLPGATINNLPNEGHFSFFFFCDDCHRQIFSTLLEALKVLSTSQQAKVKSRPKERWKSSH
ncbi:Alpha/beta-Hydrolases superfamily protein isoform 2 [Hibiscus syriacus]|uniref:Alpha/beta-Hydrolases superfamily protein isoform 2 n=1 Tax=Hibiscus syriacus TaxID=106335 RepID=A0A6A3BQA0_HIBSY|nr:Alpha/beta-Hydrolases superfamily protein isoform 2 [Hibiscus syriacus]